jgi:hypothetical protein
LGLCHCLWVWPVFARPPPPPPVLLLYLSSNPLCVTPSRSTILLALLHLFAPRLRGRRCAPNWSTDCNHHHNMRCVSSQVLVVGLGQQILSVACLHRAAACDTLAVLQHAECQPMRCLQQPSRPLARNCILLHPKPTTECPKPRFAAIAEAQLCFLPQTPAMTERYVTLGKPREEDDFSPRECQSPAALSCSRVLGAQLGSASISQAPWMPPIQHSSQPLRRSASPTLRLLDSCVCRRRWRLHTTGWPRRQQNHLCWSAAIR